MLSRFNSSQISLFFLFLLTISSCSSNPNGNAKEAGVESNPKAYVHEAPTKAMIEAEVKRQKDSVQSITLNAISESQEICSGSPIPQGWIITGGRWCPTCCGYSGGGIYNDNQPVGTIMDVCSGLKTPSGWVIIGGRWCPTCCGYSGGGIYNNVIQIKRLS
jgi:hypothetical protein